MPSISLTDSTPIAPLALARDGWKDKLQIAGFVALYKLAFFAYIGLVMRALPTSYNGAEFRLHALNDAQLSAGWWRYFETWDAQHYLHLAQHGYGDSAMSLAFYPLWPLLIRLFAPLFGGNATLTALVLANLFSTLALVGLHGVVRRRFDAATAQRALLLMLVFPGALFFCLPYAESLFLLLCVALFALLEKSVVALPTAAWKFAAGVALCAAGAALARPTGLFLVVPLLDFAWGRRALPVWRPIFLAPVVGIVGYFLVIYGATGDYASGLKAQALFSARPSVALLFDVPTFVRGFFDFDPARGARAMINDRIWFALFAATLWPLWKLNKLWFAFALVMGLLPAMTASMMSFMRYASVIFPCFVVAALWFRGPRARPVFPLLVACLLLIQMFYVAMHINYFWAA